MTSLREVRAARLLSIRELARQASVAPSTIYLIESGRTVPRSRVVRALVAVLSVDPERIEEFRRAIEQSKVGAQRPNPARREEDPDDAFEAVRSGLRQAITDAGH
jgi:transcriptional regulator with XRE-family HTH domain